MVCIQILRRQKFRHRLRLSKMYTVSKSNTIKGRAITEKSNFSQMILRMVQNTGKKIIENFKVLKILSLSTFGIEASFEW